MRNLFFNSRTDAARFRSALQKHGFRASALEGSKGKGYGVLKSSGSWYFQTDATAEDETILHAVLSHAPHAHMEWLSRQYPDSYTRIVGRLSNPTGWYVLMTYLHSSRGPRKSPAYGPFERKEDASRFAERSLLNNDMKLISAVVATSEEATAWNLLLRTSNNRLPNPLIDTRTGGKGTSGAESEVIIEETTPFDSPKLKAIRKVATTSERHTGHVMRYPLSKTEAFKGAARTQAKLGSDYMVFKSGSSYGYAPINWVDAAVVDTGRWANPGFGGSKRATVSQFAPNVKIWTVERVLAGEAVSKESLREFLVGYRKQFSKVVFAELLRIAKYAEQHVKDNFEMYRDRKPLNEMREQNPAPGGRVDAAVTDTSRWANPSDGESLLKSKFVRLFGEPAYRQVEELAPAIAAVDGQNKPQLRHLAEAAQYFQISTQGLTERDNKHAPWPNVWEYLEWLAEGNYRDASYRGGGPLHVERSKAILRSRNPSRMNGAKLYDFTLVDERTGNIVHDHPLKVMTATEARRYNEQADSEGHDYRLRTAKRYSDLDWPWGSWDDIVDVHQNPSSDGKVKRKLTVRTRIELWNDTQYSPLVFTVGEKVDVYWDARWGKGQAYGFRSGLAYSNYFNSLIGKTVFSNWPKDWVTREENPKPETVIKGIFLDALETHYSKHGEPKKHEEWLYSAGGGIAWVLLKGHTNLQREAWVTYLGPLGAYQATVRPSGFGISGVPKRISEDTPNVWRIKRLIREDESKPSSPNNDWDGKPRMPNPISLLDAVAFGAASAFASEVVRPVMRKYITHPQAQSAEGVTT